MRKNSGIIRNKISFLQESKSKISRKKNRFQSVNKNDQSFETCRYEQMVATPNSSTEQGINMVGSELHQNQQISYKDIYDKAKKKLSEVTQIQKKMLNLTKARLTSFKEKEYEKYDENISKLASEATNLLFEADKCLKNMNQIQRGSSSDQKLIQNMSKSLASQIREISKNLRQQQKQYFDTIRCYQKNAKNTAIELSEQQRQIMKSMEQEMQQQTNDMLNNKKVDELVKNINKLSTIYKELNSLVIEQGSLIDRIDVNIQSTLTHTKQAVVHLEAADQHASSPLADRIMKVMVIMILILAIVLGLKWAA